ncbi:carbohydrate ABC transporter permease [Fundicoccus culcitae]|uniref:Sugar ABC transporter permease n=1 Tax=Fundicoccus culcitae TaxID=2969821 RepID=A0ABY5P9I5_9LACT|nr:sugar ABC transporter permease [Fundicoccus culcitae]UUX35120.1 sugar ABC transporter permease [Fundicoccus culcitae]
MTQRKEDNRQNIIGWILNSPYLIHSIIFFLLPLNWAIFLSFMDWNLMSSDRTFVGLDNFIDLFNDNRVKAAFINSYKYLLPIVTLCFAFGLLIAVLVSKLPNKIKGIVAVLFFIPYLTSGVATSVVVKYFFNYNSIFNEFLRDTFGLNINWLTDQKYAFWVMVGIVVWKMSGYYALFILSGLENIDGDINEAAALDGSTGFHKLFHITLPMLMPTLTTVLVLATGLAFGIFTEPFLLTGGGPNLSTTTWQLEIYNASFTRFDSGYGAAMAIASAVQVFITLRIINYFTDRLNKRFGY